MRSVVTFLTLIFSMTAMAWEVGDDMTAQQRTNLTNNCPASGPGPEGEPTNNTKIKNCVAINHEDRIDALEASGGGSSQTLVDDNGVVVGDVLVIDFAARSSSALVGISTTAGSAVVTASPTSLVGISADIVFESSDCTGVAYIGQANDVTSSESFFPTIAVVVGVDGSLYQRDGSGPVNIAANSRFDGSCQACGFLPCNGNGVEPAELIFDTTGHALPYAIQ